MPELRDQPQSALGSAYELRREFGGGGMSRVFLARESALGRDVVVKVVHPELASGVNIDRFKREIQLAAQLQAADTAYDGAPISWATCIAPRLARPYDLAGRPDDATREFENYLNSTYARRGATADPQFLAGSYKRLAELYEAKGDRAKAGANYAKFIDLWKNADPEMQPKVQEAKRRLARLGAEGR